MRALLILPILLINLTMPTVANAASSQPKIYAVTFFAEWCGACKLLEPKIEAARIQKQYDPKDIEFITMDFTDRAHIDKSVELSKELGFHWLLKKNGSGTGYMAIIDPVRKQEIARIHNELSLNEIQAKLTNSIKN